VPYLFRESSLITRVWTGPSKVRHRLECKRSNTSHLIIIWGNQVQTRTDAVYETDFSNLNTPDQHRCVYSFHHPRPPSLPSTDPRPYLPSRLVGTLIPISQLTILTKTALYVKCVAPLYSQRPVSHLPDKASPFSNGDLALRRQLGNHCKR